MDAGASKMIYMISVMLLFSENAKKPRNIFYDAPGQGRSRYWLVITTEHSRLNAAEPTKCDKLEKNVPSYSCNCCVSMQQIQQTFRKKKMAPEIGEKIRFLKPKYLRYGYKLRGKWNNSENNSWKRRGIFFFHSKMHENALEKSEHFRRKMGKIAPKQQKTCEFRRFLFLVSKYYRIYGGR